MQGEKKYIFNGAEYRAVKKFFSRINSVWLLESTDEGSAKFVLKDFKDNNDRLKAEMAGMEIFKEFSPKMIYSDTRYLIHEYIQGETFLSYFENAEKSNTAVADPVTSMLNFLGSMYESAPGYILGDINFNNFIISGADADSKIKFVDYENVKVGEREEDIGRIIAFALTYDPSFTDWKYKFVSEFIEKSVKILKADKAKIYFYAEKEFQAMNVRRQLQTDIPEVLKKIKIQ